MLSSFKQHPKRNRLELKLRKTKIKFHSWWNKFYYGGGPSNDPTILTRRPRNVPFISLRNDEYCEFLKIEENRAQKNIEKTRLPSYSVCVRNFDHNEAINQVLQNNYYISRRLKQKKSNSKELGFSIYQDNFKDKQNSESNLKLSIVDTPRDIDNSTLSSFEQDLMSFASEKNRDRLLPFGKPAKSRDDNNCFNGGEKDENTNYSFEASGTYYHQMDNMLNGKYIADYEENKENNTDSFLKLFDDVGKDQDTNENSNCNYGEKNEFRSWLNNKLLIEKDSESKTNQKKHAGRNSHNLNKSARIPMIQRPEFFEKRLSSEDSNYSFLVDLNSEKLESLSGRKYFKASQPDNQQKKKVKIINKSTRMRLEILKANTIERISSLISLLPSFRSTWIDKSVSVCLTTKNIKELYPDLHHIIINDLSLSAAKIAAGEFYELSTSRKIHNKPNADLTSFNNFEDPVFFGNIKVGEENLTVRQAKNLTYKTEASQKTNQIKKNKRSIATKASSKEILDSNYSVMPDRRVALNFLAENQFDYVEKTSGNEIDIIASYQQLSG